jgi:hypothetical protein
LFWLSFRSSLVAALQQLALDDRDGMCSGLIRKLALDDRDGMCSGLIRSFLVTEKIEKKYEVFMAVTMENVILLDVMLCGSCKNQSFGETCRLHHQDGKNQRSRNANRVKI